MSDEKILRDLLHMAETIDGLVAAMKNEIRAQLDPESLSADERAAVRNATPALLQMGAIGEEGEPLPPIRFRTFEEASKAAKGAIRDASIMRVATTEDPGEKMPGAPGRHRTHEVHSHGKLSAWISDPDWE